jgi:hypothetical protein
MVSREELEFERRLTKEKQDKFLEIVNNASKALRIKPPETKFWDGECPHSRGNELAHIHPDTGVICVSSRRLKQMTMEDIVETATHEVSHMLDSSHDYSFKGIHNYVKTKIWKPPQGIAVEDEDERDKEHPKEHIREDRIKCNYHLCRKKTTLKKCSYCGGYFCNEHVSPKLPLTYGMVDSERNPTLARLYEDEWRKKGGHPDAVYSEYKLNKIAREEKELTDRIMKALDRMKRIETTKYPKKSGFNVFSRIPKSLFLKSESSTKNITKGDKEHREYFSQKIKQSIPAEHSEPSKEEKEFRIPTKTVAIIILLIIFGYLIFTYNKEIMKFIPFSNKTKECIANFTKTYASGASFGRDPSAYCKNTCIEKYNSTIYKLIEQNETSKLTVCYCDVNNCNS